MPALILFLAACAGHAALLVFQLNWWYGHALPEKLLGAIRHFSILLIIAGPVALWWWFGIDLTDLPALASHSLSGLLLAGYIALCWIAGVLVVPWVTIGRLLKRPAALVDNHTRVIDVAAHLGYKPIGRGRHRIYAHFPANNIFRVDFAEKTIRLPQLPAAWDGLSILHLSDLHLHGTPDRAFFAHVMEESARWEPDLVTLTGDVVDSPHHHRWILPLLGKLRWRIGAFAVVGNHDYWHDPRLVRRRLRRLGIHVLGNTWTQLDVRGEPMVLVGNESPWFKPPPELTACPAGVFKLCLSHTPDNIAWAKSRGIDLMLAGHNHGGQIRFPILGSVLVPSLYGRRYDCGLYEEKPTLLHVSRGLSGQHPLRYNCRPEVTKVVLRTPE